jgi:cytochrome bd-type quinol oxidase subunit 2
VAILGTAADIGCDLNLLLQLGTLGVLLVGVRYGGRSTHSSIRKHWSIMAVAGSLNLVGLATVMAPALEDFITNAPDFASLWAVTSLPHAALGAVVAVMVASLGTLYFANDSPRNMRAWMKLMFAFWVANIVLGISLYMQMAGFI